MDGSQSDLMASGKLFVLGAHGKTCGLSQDVEEHVLPSEVWEQLPYFCGPVKHAKACLLVTFIFHSAAKTKIHKKN